MTAWTLTPREDVTDRVDASSIRLTDWYGKRPGEIERTPLTVGSQRVCLADVFSIRSTDDGRPRIVIDGDLGRFDRIGDGHAAGLFHVEGDVGDYAGGAMSGGLLRIQGSAGNHLAAPHDAARQGMKGGRITVGGSAGNYLGHRMRRGEVFVAGDAGRFAASQMFAGTIVVAGHVGADAASGMRRGTLITRRSPELPGRRFTKAVSIRSVFPRLLDLPNDRPEGIRRLIDQIASAGWSSRRGDRAVGGKGEILSVSGET